MKDAVTLSVPGHVFWGLMTLAGLLALSGLIVLALPRAGTRAADRPAWMIRLGLGDMPRALVWTGILGWSILVLSLLIGLFGTIWAAIINLVPAPGAEVAWRVTLITLAGLTATLGAVIALPFTLLRTHFSRRQTEATEQGLITDRINTAVQALGTDKEVNEHLTNDQGEKLYHERDGAAGELDFKRPVMVTTTRPNLEVRIGAILALERLARQNLDFHVQIMEILCAYVRENAPASSATPDPDLFESLDALPKEDRTGEDGTPIPPHALWGEVRKRNAKTLATWKADLPATRTDILTALQVISRRDADQRRTEAKHIRKDGEYVFDRDPPDYADNTDPKTYREKAGAYREALHAYPGYRPDLRNTNLQGVDLAHFDLRGLRFDGARMQGADLWGAQMQGADLQEARVQGANLRGARMQGAVLRGAQMQGAVLRGARMQGADLWVAQMQGADLWWAEMQGADLGGARMQGADLGWAQMDEYTDLTAAVLRGAGVRSVDDKTITQLRPFWADVFAYGSVPVAADDPDRPDHWPPQDLDPAAFYQKWRAWQATLPAGRDRSD
ncbi:MAG: Pentapeptide repeats (8 copies) [Rhodobacteraceae bacterium HLUCCA08]|nr:MAG: Pentapeptide repeats (8 copies) [Rhodobacteraceae bacterium HLUCCA08]